MPNIMLIERAKNQRAMRRISNAAFIMIVVIMLLVFWKCWHAEVAPTALLRFTDRALPCLTLLVIQLFRTENSKTSTKRSIDKKKQGKTKQNNIKYDFHVY